MNQGRSCLGKSLSFVCAIALGTACVGCTPSNTVKPGAPVLMSFGVVDTSGSPVETTGDAGAAPVPPLVHFVATFDRLLDPTTLEDTAGMAKAGVAFGQSDVANTAINVTTTYVPNGDSKFFLLLPPGPSLTVAPTCGLPTAASVQVRLDLEKLRSHDQSAVTVPAPGVTSTLMFQTKPLEVSTDIPAPPDPIPVGGPLLVATAMADFVVNVSFTAFTPGPSAPSDCAALPSTLSHIHVSGTLAGVPVAVIDAVVAQDPMDPTHWTVSPPGTTADAPGAWPVGVLITVTIDANATDTFGKSLGSETSASFMVQS